MTLAPAANPEKPLRLGLHVTPVARDDVAAHERSAEAAQLGSLVGLIDDRRPKRHRDRRITRRLAPIQPSRGRGPIVCTKVHFSAKLTDVRSIHPRL